MASAGNTMGHYMTGRAAGWQHQRCACAARSQQPHAPLMRIFTLQRRGEMAARQRQAGVCGGNCRGATRRAACRCGSHGDGRARHAMRAQVWIGMLLLVELVTPYRQLLLLFSFWNFLRVRYISSAHTRVRRTAPPAAAPPCCSPVSSCRPRSARWMRCSCRPLATGCVPPSFVSASLPRACLCMWPADRIVQAVATCACARSRRAMCSYQGRQGRAGGHRAPLCESDHARARAA